MSSFEEVPLEGITHPVGSIARVTPGPVLCLTAGQDHSLAPGLRS